MIPVNEDQESTSEIADEIMPSPRYNLRLSRRNSITSELGTPRSNSFANKYGSEVEYSI